jgi:hypothetical protein
VRVPNGENEAASLIVTSQLIPNRYRLPGANVFPEGIAADPETRQFYVGSATDGTIFRGSLAEPHIKPLIPAGANGCTSALGLAIDRAGRLVVAGGSTGWAFVYDNDCQLVAKAKSDLYLQLVKSARLPPAMLNSVAVAGEVAYFTDSIRPVLFRFSFGSSEPLEPWIGLRDSAIHYAYGDDLPASVNLNGIVASNDERFLLAVQSNSGAIFRMSINDRTVDVIDLNGDLVVGGDGLALDGATLYVIRAGPEQIIPIELSEDLTRGRVGKFSQQYDLRLPTSAAIAGRKLLIVESQFDALIAGQPKLPFTVASVDLPR